MKKRVRLETKCICGIGSGLKGHRDWCPCYVKDLDAPPMSEEAMAEYRERANRPNVEVASPPRPLCPHNKDMKDVCHECLAGR
jgi:hypothetical protein